MTQVYDVTVNEYSAKQFNGTTELSSRIGKALLGILNTGETLKGIIKDGLMNDLAGIKAAIAEQARNAWKLDDNGKASSALRSSVNNASRELTKEYKTIPQYGIQSVKGKPGQFVLGVAKPREKSKTSTLTKGMEATAKQIVEGREYGDMLELMAQFLQAADLDADTLRELADMMEAA